MPKIDLSILNQKQTPAFYASSLATRPAFGFPGRIFIDTDSPSTGLYRDTGTAWVQIADPGAGTTGTLQQVTTNGNTTTNDIKLTTPAKLIVGAQYNQLYASGSLNLDLTISGDDAINFVTDNQATAQGGFLIGGGFYTNYNVGIKTNTPGASLDVHGDTNVLEQLNQTTATNNTLIAFQNSGAALWRIGNFYNTGANDWGIYDVVGAAQPLTVKKTTGQVLIGTSTVGAGKLVVSSASADNGVQVVGASAPSLRIDNAATGATKRAGLGISTATNNFIQGSADRDFCIFNGSTAAASPILFGVYDAGAVNVQEAARISAARNFLIGTTTDSGEKLIVNGAGRFNGAVNIFDTTQATSSSSGCLILNGGLGISKNIFSSANILTNSGVIAPLNGGSIEVYAAGNSNYFDLKSSGGNFSLRTNLGVSAVNALTIASTGAATFSGVITSNGNLGFTNSNSSQAGSVADFTGASPLKVSFSTYTDTLQCYNETSGYSIFNFTPSSKKFVVNPSGGNFLIGTTTDVGAKLNVSGSIYSSGNIQIAKSTPGLLLSGTSFGNSGSYLNFEGWATTNYNIQLAVGTTGGAGLEILRSTAIGGTSFGSVIGSFNQTTGVYTPLSDINKKKNFEASNLGLDAILNLKPTLYNMISQNDNEAKELGFIAQEVKEVIEQAYIENGEFIGLNYQAIVATLVKAIQELNTKIENLK